MRWINFELFFLPSIAKLREKADPLITDCSWVQRDLTPLVLRPWRFEDLVRETGDARRGRTWTGRSRCSGSWTIRISCAFMPPTRMSVLWSGRGKNTHPSTDGTQGGRREWCSWTHRFWDVYSLGLLAHILRRQLDPPLAPQAPSKDVVGAPGTSFVVGRQILGGSSPRQVGGFSPFLKMSLDPAGLD